MAEVYGVKPKIFTREWWPYFWLYYKWHTVAVLFVTMLVTMVISECAKREKYDLRLTMLGTFYAETESLISLETALEPAIEDIDGNEEKNIDIMSLVFVDKAEYDEENFASYIKHDSEFSDPLMQMFIYDKRELERRDAELFLPEAFCETDEWLQPEVDEDLLYYGSDGKPYAVSLKNSSILNECGINGENLYVLVKNDADAPKQNPKAHQNAVITANNLIK